LRVGIVGDIHAPFVHPMYLRFCQDVFASWQVDRVVLIGDIVDSHALSFWEHDPNGRSAEDEAQDASPIVAKWHDTFPGERVCIGNHDERHYRVARKAGLPDRYLRGYAEVWGTDSWRWDYSHEIDKVKYLHGTGLSGKDAAYNHAVESRQSVGMGHIHTSGGVKVHTNSSSRIFGLAVGCGIDCPAYAFAYGRPFAKRPTLGCGIVIDGDLAVFEPMQIGKGEKYHRSRAGKPKRRRTRKRAA
jgi:predicted phosphodiesterase